MDSKILRQKFIDFFKEKGHAVLPSASLVPENDPSVLFATAGMFPFKRYYSFPDEAPSSRVTTSQKCIRTGDIYEVGDNTHLTFFEMLGNFSFGYQNSPVGRERSYFKKEAIEMAWEFLTRELSLDKSRMYATYFKGEKGVPSDEESFNLLKKLPGLPEIKPQGFDDNFWSLGTENSPGGPTVEFYVDGIEVWNLVFNEFILKNGKYEPAKLKGVDTGMGLERLVAVLSKSESVYDTDLFQPLVSKIEQLSGKKYFDAQNEMRVIADHLKAAVFAIGDGALPSNKDRGYVVRRLIRRAIVKAQQLGIEKNFTAEIAKKVFKIYDGLYFNCVIPAPAQKGVNSGGILSKIPDQVRDDNMVRILAELEKEETKFRRTLREGLKLIQSNEELDGKKLFDLYQSYGLPLEISIEEAGRQGIEINNSTIEQFNNLLLKHQDLSRTASAGMFKGGLAQGGEIETKYHTATHLLHAALRKVLGEHVQQKGSNINTERLRFDFSHPDKMTSEQIKEVEGLVNKAIADDLSVTMEEMTVDGAKKSGAIGLFESKYGDKVKVYTIGEKSGDSLEVDFDSSRVAERGDGKFFSREICGGPHVAHTGELGHFKISKEEASS
ncbi:MAG TPA: alanine--tRNA ligase-related protein, partial [bacterium]|nr:alanine--tRNA ligase-related protein [bacterium]